MAHILAQSSGSSGVDFCHETIENIKILPASLILNSQRQFFKPLEWQHASNFIASGR
jgi:hypothetical protein